MNEILKTLTSGKFWKELVIMTLGMAVGAAAVYYFLMPSKLIIGSISGLSIVLSEIFGNAGIPIKVSTIILVINARAVCESEKLSEILQDAAEEAAEQAGAKMRVYFTECFGMMDEGRL